MPDGSSVSIQTAITQLATAFFQQATEPTVGVSEGDLWYDLTFSVLKVRQSGIWVQVLAQPDLTSANIDSGYF
jgi:hypothetical protein